jgi:16S rRNA (guanine527-N7)-methyltransferase
MDTERIGELLLPFFGGPALSGAQLNQLSLYLDHLLKWNAKINLTAVRDPEEIVTRHFGESLFAARHLLVEPMVLKSSIIDIGSGAGFPGIPLKIWAPGLKLTLIESNHKKVAFLREAARLLKMSDTEVLPIRAEVANTKADLVTLRAVERFEQVLPTARHLMNADGLLALLVGANQEKAALIVLPDLVWETPLPIPLSQSRVLLIGRIA